MREKSLSNGPALRQRRTFDLVRIVERTMRTGARYKERVGPRRVDLTTPELAAVLERNGVASRINRFAPRAGHMPLNYMFCWR